MPADQKTTSSTFNLIWLLSYISIASVSANMITPALPVIQTHFHLDSGSVEWIVSAFLIGYVSGQLIYGPLANCYGRLKALRIGLVVNLLGIFACLIATACDNFQFLILGRLITSLGAASGLACTFMLINEWLPEAQRKSAMSYSVLSFALGAGFSVMIGGLITEYWTWQGCFWFLLLHGIVMLIGTQVFSETLLTPKPIHARTILKDYAKALSTPKLLIYSLIVGYCAAIAYCFSAAGPQIAESLLHLSPAEYGYWNGVNIIGMLSGGFLVKELLTHYSALRVIILGLAGVAAGIISLVLLWCVASHSALWFFITTSSLYLFSGFLFSGGSLIASNALTDKASAAAMMSFVNMCFATLAVIVMGYLTALPLVGFILILCLIWVILIALLIIDRLNFCFHHKPG